MHLIPVLGRQTKADCYEFKSSLAYIVSQGYRVRPCFRNKIQNRKKLKSLTEFGRKKKEKKLPLIYVGSKNTACKRKCL